jgi:hypothetical protein
MGLDYNTDQAHTAHGDLNATEFATRFNHTQAA